MKKSPKKHPHHAAENAAATATSEQEAAAVASQPAASDSAPAEPAEPSLHELIGDDAIEKAVDLLTQKLSSDPRFNFFLFGIGRDEQGKKHRTFLSMALGHPCSEAQAAAARQFSRLFEQGLQDRHFDVVLDHLQDTLKELDIADELSDSVLTASKAARKLLFSR